jgi:hypothetical protein
MFSMSERKDVDEWADALLDQHRSDPDPEPPLQGLQWLTRERPRLTAFMEAGQAIGLIVLSLLALLFLHVAFNSG